MFWTHFDSKIKSLNIDNELEINIHIRGVLIYKWSPTVYPKNLWCIYQTNTISIHWWYPKMNGMQETVIYNSYNCFSATLDFVGSFHTTKCLGHLKGIWPHACVIEYYTEEALVQWIITWYTTQPLSYRDGTRASHFVWGVGSFFSPRLIGWWLHYSPITSFMTSQIWLQEYFLLLLLP